MRSLLKGLIVIFGLVFASGGPTSTRCPSPTLEEAKKSSSALADFAVNFYKNVSAITKDKNAVMSPLSVALALALLENGADGATRNQIKNLLVQVGSNVDVLTSYRALQTQLRIDDPKTKLSIANGMFQDKNLQLKSEYVSSTKDCLETEVAPVDFAQLEATRQKINQWVSDKTSAKIPELFKQGALTPDTVLVLANAIYFKSSWRTPFNVGSTKQQTFYRFGRDQDPQSVPFMKSVSSYGHKDDSDWQVVELPYDHDDLSFFVLLPKQRDGLSQLEQSLTGEKLKGLVSDLEPRQVSVELPKFTIRSPIDLRDILGKFGLDVIFADSADFGRMSETALKVSKAVHEAFIDVKENGTEAAAATGFGMTGRSMSRPLNPVKFVADHPFLYSIIHKPTGAAIFLGKVNFVEEGN